MGVDNTESSARPRTDDTRLHSKSRTVRYVICYVPDMNVYRNYRCHDRMVSIGNYVRVSDEDQKLEVVAVVESDIDAVPELTLSVLSLF